MDSGGQPPAVLSQMGLDIVFFVGVDRRMARNERAAGRPSKDKNSHTATLLRV